MCNLILGFDLSDQVAVCISATHPDSLMLNGETEVIQKKINLILKMDVYIYCHESLLRKAYFFLFVYRDLNMMTKLDTFTLEVLEDR